MNDATSDKNPPVVGFNTGLTLQFPFNEKVFAKAGLLYSIKGFNSLLIPQGTAPTRLKYIAIPALLGFTANKKLSFLFGPELCILANAQMKIGKDKINKTSNFQKFDIGLDIGAIYHINKKFGIEIRYNYGLTKIEKFYYYDTNGNVTGFKKSGKNRVLQFNLFYNLKK